ncbi:MAG: septation protein A [Pseudomonadota bacterium]
MKLLFDFLPILLFFAAYKFYDIYVATTVAIVASLLQVGYLWIKHRKVESMHLITLALVVVLGGATLLLHDETFIKWKPTGVNWLFAAVFFGSLFIGEKTVLERLMGANVELPKQIWSRLTAAWASFFFALGALNIYVAFNFDTDTWVNFKLFGMMGLTIAFVIGQAIYLSRHVQQQVPEAVRQESNEER